jgi:hypothetical protein
MREAMMVAALLAAGCGGTAVDVAGTYEGSCAGSLTLGGFTFPWDGGTVTFTLQPAGDIYTATGTLSVKPKYGAPYNANISGSVTDGRASLMFNAVDGKSSGTMSASFSGSCWPDGKWTVSSTNSSGSGTWQACRK